MIDGVYGHLVKGSETAAWERLGLFTAFAAVDIAPFQSSPFAWPQTCVRGERHDWAIHGPELDDEHFYFVRLKRDHLGSFWHRVAAGKLRRIGADQPPTDRRVECLPERLRDSVT